MAFGLRDAGQFHAEGRVVEHRDVRQQRERLEHHADVLAAQGAQFGVRQGIDVVAVDHDPAGGRLHQAIEHAHQGRLARAGQAHDDEDLAGFDGEAGVEYTDRATGLGQDVLLGGALANQRQGVVGLVAVDLEDLVDDDLFCHVVVLLRFGEWIEPCCHWRLAGSGRPRQWRCKRRSGAGSRQAGLDTLSGGVDADNGCRTRCKSCHGRAFGNAGAAKGAEPGRLTKCGVKRGRDAGAGPRSYFPSVGREIR